MIPALAEHRTAAPQARATTHTPVAIYLAVGLSVAAALAAAALQPWVPATDLLRDAQNVAARHGDSHTAYGLVSNLGAVVTAMAAGSAVIAWVLLRGRTGPLRSLVLWSALISLGLVLDDLLLLHETAAFVPGASIGVAAAYGIVFIRYLIRFRTTIRQQLDAGLLVVALAAFAASALVDIVMDPTQWSVFVEDGAKLLGLVAWSVFVIRGALVALRPTRSHRRVVAVN